MAITCSESKKEEFERFKKEGGDIVFEIDAEDISTDREFESFPSIKPNLKSGFELPPISMIEAPELQVLISVYPAMVQPGITYMRAFICPKAKSFIRSLITVNTKRIAQYQNWFNKAKHSDIFSAAASSSLQSCACRRR